MLKVRQDIKGSVTLWARPCSYQCDLKIFGKMQPEWGQNVKNVHTTSKSRPCQDLSVLIILSLTSYHDHALSRSSYVLLCPIWSHNLLAIERLRFNAINWASFLYFALITSSPFWTCPKKNKIKNILNLRDWKKREILYLNSHTPWPSRWCCPSMERESPRGPAGSDQTAPPEHYSHCTTHTHIHRYIHINGTKLIKL